MKTITSLSLLLVLFAGYSLHSQTILPKGFTDAERAIYNEYLSNIPLSDKSGQPPSSPPRTPAEFEEAGGLIVTWAAYSSELREIIRHAALRVPVYIVSNNASQVQNFLIQGNVDMTHISILQFPFNSVWVRDFGPQSVYLRGTDQLAFVDWIYNRPRPDDNLIPFNMANHLDLPFYQMTSAPNALTATGGNFMTDGHGTAFSSKLILSENAGLTESAIDSIMLQFKGIDRYIKMDELPYDNISHIDMHMKLLDEERILVGQFPPGVSDGPFIEDNLAYLLANYTSTFGRDYQIINVPMVPSPSGNYPPSAHYRTYTNSLILNDLILVPTYNHTALNEQALAVYQDAMPGYEIIGINMENVISASGAIHCITREIAAEDPILIAHAPIRETIWGNDDDYLIEAFITNATGVLSASVFYRLTGETDYQEVSMTNVAKNLYVAHIPSQFCGASIEYYISATNEHKTITRPFPGASGPWAFQTDDSPSDFSASTYTALTHTPISFFYTGCLDEDVLMDAVWNFGEGAVPSSSVGIDSVSVFYETPGHKTITLTIDTIEIVKEGFVLITEQIAYSLLLGIEGKGDTQPAPGYYQFNENEEVLLSATPAEGWVFEEWQISGIDKDLPQTEVLIAMDNHYRVKAFFRQIETPVSEWQENFLFDVFPNPASKRFTVVMTPSSSPVTIEVFNMTGSSVYKNTLEVTDWDQQYHVDLSNGLPGIYLVKLSYFFGKESRVKRIMIM